MLFAAAKSCLEWVPAAFRRSGGSGQNVAQDDSKHIARQWDREIEDEIRREAELNPAGGPWKVVVWGALWVLWLALLVSLISRAKLG